MIRSLESQSSKKLKKGREIYYDFWKIKAKNSQKCLNLVKSGQSLNILDLFKHTEYNFFKKLYEQHAFQKLGRFMAEFGSYRSKLSKLSILAGKRPNFGLKWPKFCPTRIFQAYRV